MLETELKFEIHDSFAVPSFERNTAGVARVEEVAPQDLRATYYDTEDLRLARNGITLRFRTGGEEGETWSLKLPAGKDVHTREELHFEGSPDAIPAQACKLVSAHTRSAPLADVATLRTKRRRWSLRGEVDEELAELVEDDVSVLEDGQVVGRFRELELEGRTADLNGLKQMAEVLRRAGASTAAPIPKAVRAMGHRATAPPDVSPGEEIRPTDPAAAAVRAALANGVARLLSNDPLARLEDEEAVHQVRVAARRLRSDLRTFSPLVDGKWADDLAGELRWLADALGEVRDSHVMQERLQRTSATIDGPLTPLFDSLSERYSSARSKMLDAFGSPRYEALIERLIEAAREPKLTDESLEPCAIAMPPLVGIAWKKLATRARALRPDDDDEAFHNVRIRAKRTRYAAEAVAPTLPEEARKQAAGLARGAEHIQEVLGAHQDAVVAQETIRSVAESRAGGAFAFAAGRLFERQRQAAAEGRAEFFRLWGKLDRKKHRRWLKT